MSLPKKGYFVKKPIPIQAEQWFPGDKISGLTEIRHTQLGLVGRIETLEGIHYALPGDYIIVGIHGEIYPCKEDIFNESYEVYQGET